MPYLIALTLIVAAVPAVAQETGSISGVVHDPEAVPLPGVLVTVDGALIPPTTTVTQRNGVYRFPTLPPAEDYVLTFELDGFQTVVHEGLIVRVGGGIQISPTLSIAGVAETVTVVGESPLLDLTRTGSGNTVTERYMQSIPSARDPWVMLEHTAGVQVGTQNVGGSNSGQQDIFTANGTALGDTVWTYDGAEITGPLGESSLYYDFDALEEISITTGGNDPSIATGGVRLNFVTRRGGDLWRGSTRLYFTSGDLQGYTVDDYTEDELFPGYVGNSIDGIHDWGAEVGGPILRDRLFGWGAYGRQDIRTFVSNTPDNTRLSNWHGKLNAHFGDRTLASFTFVSSDKSKQGRFASATRAQETTLDQDGLTSAYTAKAQRAFNDNNYVEATFNVMDTGLSLEPQGGRDTQAAYDYATRGWSRTYQFSTTDGTSANARLDGNSYLAGANVDHDLKYGFSFRGRRRNATSGWPQSVVAGFFRGQPADAWLLSDRVDNYKQSRYSLYLGDTIHAGRATINVGLRYDHQTSVSLPSAAAASAFAPEIFPANSFAGYDPGYAWNSLSPRLGLTYDLTGDASTILRLNAARYYSQMREAELHKTNTTGFREIDLAWSDLNGNGLVDVGETGDVVWVSGGWDPSDPSAPSANVVAETSPPWTDELIAGIERQVNRSLAVGANLVYRRHGNQTWNIRTGEDDPDFWQRVIQDVPGQGELAVYEPVGPRATSTIYKQRPDYRSRYGGIELFMTRRLADRWMASASFNFGHTTDGFNGPGSYTDPTNLERLDGRPHQFAYSTRDASWGTSRWYFKGSGMYQLPAGFTVAGYLQVREGYVNPQTVLSNTRRYGAGRIDALVEDFGDTRLPTYWNVDLRAEKTFDLARLRLHVIVDAFNVTDSGAILGKEGRLNSPYYGRITNVLQGRTIRFGLRLVLR